MAKRSCGKAHTTFNFSALSSARFRTSVPKITRKSMPTGMSWDPIQSPQRSECSGSSQISLPFPPPLPAGLLEYSSDHHSPFLCFLDSFNIWLDLVAFPLRISCVSAKASWNHFSERQQKQRRGTGLGWALYAGGGVVRLLAGDRAAVNLPQGNTCLVRLASDIQSPGRTDFFFFSVLKLKTVLVGDCNLFVFFLNK